MDRGDTSDLLLLQIFEISTLTDGETEMNLDLWNIEMAMWGTS